MLRLQLIGGMQVWLNGERAVPPTSRRAWALLAWLALHPGAHPRRVIAATFWPDVLDSTARASLRSAVWALRRSLGESADHYLLFGHEQLGLRTDSPTWVDIHAVEELAALGRTEEAVAIGCGQLLPDFDEEWAIDARERYRPRIVALLENLATAAEVAGDMARAIQLTRRQQELDPLSEEPLQRLMWRLASGGDRAAALTAFGRFSVKLARELQIAPSPETRRISAALRSDRAEQ